MLRNLVDSHFIIKFATSKSKSYKIMLNLKERICVSLYPDVDIDMLFHDNVDGEEFSLSYSEYLNHRQVEEGVRITYNSGDWEYGPYSYIVSESLEEVDAIVAEARRIHKDITENWSVTKKVPELTPLSTPDAMPERTKALRIVRDKMFALLLDYIDAKNVDHPAHLEEAGQQAKELWEKIIYRWQDYGTFMYDKKEDWDLNYDNYVQDDGIQGTDTVGS